MKKSLLFISGILFASFSFGQEVLIDENFDSYSSGDYAADVSDDIITWTANQEGTTEDAFVVDAFSQSPENSLFIQQTAAAGGPTDLVAVIGGTGIVHTEFAMLIEAGEDGYFNIQTSTNPGIGWAMEVWLNVDGSVEAIRNTADVVIPGSTFLHDEWNQIVLEVNTVAMTGDLSINGVVVSSITDWDSDVGGINFFASGNSGAGRYFIDDVYATQQDPNSVGEVTSNDGFTMFPVPAVDNVSLNLDYNSNQVQVQLFSIDGSIVFDEQVIGSGALKINTNEFDAGVYMVRVAAESGTQTKRLVIR
jgi:hypothetical protein